MDGRCRTSCCRVGRWGEYLGGYAGPRPDQASPRRRACASTSVKLRPSPHWKGPPAEPHDLGTARRSDDRRRPVVHPPPPWSEPPAVAPVRHHGGAGLAPGGMANWTARRGLTERLFGKQNWGGCVLSHAVHVLKRRQILCRNRGFSAVKRCPGSNARLLGSLSEQSLTCGRRSGAGHYQLAVQPPGSRSDLPAADLRQAVDCLHLRDQGFGVSTGHIFFPTGRKNWRLSVSCEPGKKQPARSKETAGAEIPLPAVRSLVRVIGNFGRQCRAIWNRWMAGEWQSFPGDILMQRKRWSAPENCAPRPDFQPSAEVGVKACNPPPNCPAESRVRGLTCEGFYALWPLSP